MPLLTVHLSIIQEVIARLDVPQLQEALGSALLGSTAPDRRVITRQPREETHFFQLTEDGLGDGFRGLRMAHPEVTQSPESFGWSASAFLIGYISHLVSDEVWIVDVYRPFFADDNYLGAEPARNILDRALQYDLERVVLEDQEQLKQWHETLTTALPIELPESFITADTLTDWHEFVMNAVLTRDGGWNEFPRFIARFKDDPGLDQEEVEEFLANPDVMFQRVYAKVPRAVVTNYREHAIAASIESARELLT